MEVHAENLAEEAAKLVMEAVPVGRRIERAAIVAWLRQQAVHPTADLVRADVLLVASKLEKAKPGEFPA